jgi:hypothetical protein
LEGREMPPEKRKKDAALKGSATFNSNSIPGEEKERPG